MPALHFRRALVAVFALCLALLGAQVASGVAAHAATTVGAFEAEQMTSLQGYGDSLVSSSDASGGRALKVDSNVTNRATFTTSGAADTLVIRAHTDSGVSAAKMTVTVDGVAFPVTSVAPSVWTNFSYSRAWPAGSHRVDVAFTNACCRNLYLDVLTFTGSGTTGGTVGTQLQAYVTGYSWYDNTPPGSATISNPVIHQQAGGTGSYTDPVTVAVGHNLSTGTDVLDWPAGTRFYIPSLHRYFIVEDTCGDGPTPQNGPCHTGYPSPATTWLDVWVGGQHDTSSQADACMNAITDVHTVIKDPASGYAVAPGDIASNGCTQLYPETAQTA